MSSNNQNLLKIYAGSLAVSCVFYILYWFAPWMYGGFSPEAQGILSYGGFGAWIEIPESLSWALFVLVVISYAGMLFFKKILRMLFLLLKLFTLIVSPIYGMSVITGIEVLISDTSTLLSGFSLALAYFSPLKEHFD